MELFPSCDLLSACVPAYFFIKKKKEQKKKMKKQGKASLKIGISQIHLGKLLNCELLNHLNKTDFKMKKVKKHGLIPVIPTMQATW